MVAGKSQFRKHFSGSKLNAQCVKCINIKQFVIPKKRKTFNFKSFFYFICNFSSFFFGEIEKSSIKFFQFFLLNTTCVIWLYELYELLRMNNSQSRIYAFSHYITYSPSLNFLLQFIIVIVVVIAAIAIIFHESFCMIQN